MALIVFNNLNSDSAKILKANTLYMMGLDDRVINFVDSVESKLSDKTILAYRGMSYFYVENYEFAIRDLEQAKKSNPKFTFLQHLSESYFQQKEYKLAKENIQYALTMIEGNENENDVIRAHFMFYYCLLMLNDFQFVEEALLNPPNNYILNFELQLQKILVEKYFELNEIERACNLFKKLELITNIHEELHPKISKLCN